MEHPAPTPESTTTAHLTTHELAARLAVSTRTIELLRADGTGPSHLRVGGQVRYRLADVEAWETGRLVRPVTPAAPVDDDPAAWGLGAGVEEPDYEPDDDIYPTYDPANLAA